MVFRPASMSGSTAVVADEHAHQHQHQLESDEFSSSSSSSTATTPVSADLKCVFSNNRSVHKLEDEEEEEEGSESEPATHTNNQQGQSTLLRRRRVVQFNLDKTVEHKNESHTKQDIKTLGLWYTCRDYQRFNSATMDIVRDHYLSEYCNNSKKYVTLMECVYRSTAASKLSMTEEDNAVHRNAEILRRWKSGGASENLVLSANDFIGMQQLLLSTYNKDRLRRQSDTLQLLTGLQQGRRKDAETIRQQCETISRPAVTFARLLAEAQLDPVAQVTS